MSLVRLLAPMVALLFLWSCGGGGGGGTGTPSQANSSPQVPGPSNLHSTLGPGPGEFTLLWDPPTAGFDGYNLEAKVGGEGFKQLNTGLIPVNTTFLAFYFTDTAPEATAFTFRMNTEKGGLPSAYSNTTVVTSPLYAPGPPYGYYDWNQSGVAINWSRYSTASTGFILERVQTDANGTPTGTWEPLTVADPLATSFLDKTASIGTYYTYRVTNTKGSQSSAPGTSSGAIFTGLTAPGQPTATFDFNTKGIAVTWNNYTTFSDGYRIERTITTADGVPVGNWIELTPGDPSYSRFLDTTVVINTYYSYRVTNLRGVISSTVSNPSYRAYAGLTPPSFLQASWDQNKGCVSLYWSPSSYYESINLERAACDAADKPIGSWTNLASMSAVSSAYTDLTAQETTRYLYRISGTRGSLTSNPTQAYPITTSLKAPLELTVVAAPEGLKLTWQNRSQAANLIGIQRTPGTGTSDDIAILSPGTTTYLDPLSSLGYYTYRVVARNGNVEARSQWVMAVTPNPPDSLALTTSTLYSLPSVLDAALMSTGSWALASWGPFGILSNNDPWPAYFPSDYYTSAGLVVQIDTQGRPHAIYATQSTAVGGELTLVHLWYDGSRWKSENLANAKIPFTSANRGWTYRLDTTGTPHVLLDHATTNAPYGNSTFSLTYLHKVGGAWIEESLAAFSPSITNAGSYHLTLDDSDVPHVLLGNWSTVIDYVRTPEGVWNSTVIPTSTVNAGWYDYLDALWIDGGNGWVFYESSARVNGADYSLYAVQLKAGTWQAPVYLGGREHDAANTTARSALSPDRSRIAVVYKTSAGIKCYHLAQDGWHETLVAPPTVSYPGLWMGFDGHQKAHILQWDYYSHSCTEHHE